MNRKISLILAATIVVVGCSSKTEEHEAQDHPQAGEQVQVPSGEESADSSVAMCGGHGVPEAECGVCNPAQLATLEPGQSMKVRLPDPHSAQLAGVQLGSPVTGPASDGIECLAEVVFDQNRVAQVAAPVGGIIQSVDADLGQKVSEKQTVARIWSATIAETVARAVLTHQTLLRERKLRAERVTSEKDLQQAEAEHRAACQQARTLGFTEEQIDDFGEKPEEPVMLDVKAPFAGEIVERAAVRGSLVEAGRSLFTIADRSVMWAMVSIPEDMLSRVREGQAIELRVESLPERVFPGKLTWISAKVDDRTRMATGRAELANPDGTLRANMFARARILTRAQEQATLVPAASVQRVEGRPIVFVKLEEDLFEARVVRLGAKVAGNFEVLEGLSPNESIARENAFALKSHLLISRLGVGCADE